MKTITLHLDEAMFYKLSHDKAKVEQMSREDITWEDYLASYLFAWAKIGRQK